MGKSLSHKVINQRLLNAVKYIDEKEIHTEFDASFYAGFETCLAMLENRPPTYKEAENKDKTWIGKIKSKLAKQS